MLDLITINLKLFAVFKYNLNRNFLIFRIPRFTSISDFRKQVFNKLKSEFNFDNCEIVNSSVFADNKEILSDDFLLKNDMEIYILPPVSGG